MDYKFYAILDQDNLVINCVMWPVDGDINDLLKNQYSDKYTAKEYSINDSITNTPAGIGQYYNVELNAFVPRSPGEKFKLNTETYRWEVITEE